MAMVYEAQAYVDGKQVCSEHATEDAARKVIEGFGEGKVINWHTEPNLPRCLPAIVYRSCALTVYRDGAWKHVNIFG